MSMLRKIINRWLWRGRNKKMLELLFECIRYADDRYFFDRGEFSSVDLKSWLLKRLHIR